MPLIIKPTILQFEIKDRIFNNNLIIILDFKPFPRKNARLFKQMTECGSAFS
jgi:hypothetical protein